MRSFGSTIRAGVAAALLAGCGQGVEASDPAEPTCSVATGCGWAARFNGPAASVDWAADVAVSADGRRVFVTGESSDNHGSTVAYDARNGAQLWAAYLGTPTSEIRYRPESAVVSPDGLSVFVTGMMVTQGNVDVATEAYDASTGKQLWLAKYDGGGDDSSLVVRVSPNGDAIFVGGETMSAGGVLWDYLTIAYDARDGRRLWSSRYNGSGVNSLVVSADGSGVFVTGFSDGELAAVRYDAASGAQVWAKRYVHPDTSRTAARSLALDPEGNQLFVSAEGSGPLGSDIATYAIVVAFDAASGERRWTYANPSVLDHDSSWSGILGRQSLAVSPQGGRVYVSGTYANHGPGGAETAALDAHTGERLWLKRTPAGPLKVTILESRVPGVTVAPDGSRVYVAGTLHTTNANLDYYAHGYDAAKGEWVYTASYMGSNNLGLPTANEWVMGIALDPGGRRLYTTGVTARTRYDYDFLTVAFNLL